MAVQLWEYGSYGTRYLANSSGVYPNTTNFTVMMWFCIDSLSSILNSTIYRLQDGIVWPTPSPSSTPSPSASVSKSPSVSASRSPSKSASASPSKSASSSPSVSPSISISPSSSFSLSPSQSESLSPSPSESVSPSVSLSSSPSISSSISPSRSPSVSPSASISPSASPSVSPSPPPTLSDQPAWAFGNLENNSTLYFKMYDGSGNYLSLAVGTPNATLTVGQWYHLAYVKSGSSHTVYLDGVVVSSGTLTMPLNSNSWAWGREYLGATVNARDDSYKSNKWSITYFRVWEAALSQAEVIAESLVAAAARKTNLFRDVPFSYGQPLAESIPPEEPWGVFWGLDESGSGNHLRMNSATNYVLSFSYTLGPRSLSILFSDDFNNGLSAWDGSPTIQLLAGEGDQETTCVGGSGTATKTFATPLPVRGAIRMQVSYTPTPDSPPNTQGVQTRALLFEILDTEHPSNPLGIRCYLWSHGGLEFVAANGNPMSPWYYDTYNGWAPFSGRTFPTNGTFFAIELTWHVTPCLIPGIQDYDCDGQFYINGNGVLGGGIGGYFDTFVPQWNQLTINATSSPEANIKIDSVEIDSIGEPRSYTTNKWSNPAPWPVSAAPVRAAYPIAIQTPQYSWLDVQFSRGALPAIGLKYQWWYNSWWEGLAGSNFYAQYYWVADEWKNEYNAITLYPELVGGDSFAVVNDMLEVATPPTQDMYDPLLELAVWEKPWNPLTSYYRRYTARYSPNNSRDRLFIEVRVKFDQTYYDQVGGMSGWDAAIVPYGFYSNLWLYLSGNTSAAEVENYGDSGGTPGTHTFMLITNNSDPNAAGPKYWYQDDEYRAVGSFLHAELFDGNEHVLRMEWKSATIISNASDYANGDIKTLCDGEFSFIVDGVVKFEATNIAFCLDTQKQSYLDTDADAFAALGTYEKVHIESFMSCRYVYIKAGIVGYGWVDIPEFIEQEISDSDFTGGVARVRCKLWTKESGVMIKARLYDVINGVSVGESAEVISQTPFDATFSVALTPGVSRYHLQVTSDTLDTDLFAIGAGLIP